MYISLLFSFLKQLPQFKKAVLVSLIAASRNRSSLLNLGPLFPNRFASCLIDCDFLSFVYRNKVCFRKLINFFPKLDLSLIISFVIKSLIIIFSVILVLQIVTRRFYSVEFECADLDSFE